jgi:hypothetical protein
MLQSQQGVMKRSLPVRSARVLGAALSLAISLSAEAQTTDDAGPPAPAGSIADYGGILWSDAAYAATAPARWDGQDWLEVGAGSAAVAGTALLLDRSVRNYAQGHQGDGLDKFSSHFEKFGAE